MINIDLTNAVWFALSTSIVLSIAILEFHKLKECVSDYISFWSNETKKMQTPGYLARKPGAVEIAVASPIFAIKGCIESVRIRVLGRTNIPSGRIIIVANHVDLGDTDVLAKVVGHRSGRFLISAAEVPAEKPEGILMAMCGAINVDQESRIAKVKCMKAASRALAEDGEDSLLAIFPQGMLDREEAILPETFKRGTAEIARMAAAESDAPIWIVPIGIHYKHDPKKVPLKHRALKALFNKLLPETHDGRPFFSESKYEAVAFIGEAIKVCPTTCTDSKAELILPEDREQATQMIYSSIKSAHAQALAA